ncbi:MAG: hypothetical protein WCP93_00680 [Candidatus Berkelbacteria bacterium]
MKKLSLSAILIIVAIVVIGLIGCSNKTKPTISTPLQFSVQLTIEDAKLKTVTVTADDTALSAIQKAYTYTRDADGTTIDGTKHFWSYTVDGIEPKVYIGDYKITKNCKINLKPLTLP